MVKEIENLRAEGKVAHYDYGPQSSRFGVSFLEWDEHIRPALEARPEFEGVTFRLESVIEASFLSQACQQMPRRGDGQTNTWVWYRGYYEDATCRLVGGDFAFGGLADVCYYSVVHHSNGGAVRPVGVLDARTV